MTLWVSEGTDYAVAYASNVGVGTAKATVSGRGGYAGTVVREFEIAAAKLADGTVELAETSLVYTGTPLTPAVTVEVGGRTLSEGTDYAVAYASNVGVGTAKATVTGRGGYAGTVVREFEIAAAKLADGTVELAETSLVYTGSPLTPAVTVEVGGRTLSEGADYAVAYASNVEVGTAKATVTGRGGYAGTVVREFEIATASLAGVNVELTGTSFVYNGNLQRPSVKSVGGKNLNEGADYTVKYSNSASVDAGAYTVQVIGEGNYSGVSAKASYRINAAGQGAMIKAKNKKVKLKKVRKKRVSVKPISVYNANGAVTFKKLKGNKRIKVNASTGKVTVKKGTKKGKYKIQVQVSVNGGRNYASLVKTVKVTIKVK